jgi:hypothetical protein
MKSIKLAIASFVIAQWSAFDAAAHTILDPPHPHAGANVVTWVSPTHAGGDAHEIGIHQHQHRTNHDPQAGVFDHGGAGAYVAWNVWVGRTSLNWLDGGHPSLNPETFHGHQHSPPEQANVPARYHVHAAAAGGDISASEAAAWNAGAISRTFDAFNGIGGEDGWLDVGNASGNANWPTTDDTTVAGTGVPWHSAINWVAVDGSGAHELHVIYGEASADPVTTGAGGITMPAGTQGCTTGTPLGCTWVPPGHSNVNVIVMDDDVDWFYGVDTNPANSPDQYDFATTILHEVGHVIGLGHFGTIAAGYIMTSEAQPTRSGAGGIDHTIDPDAIHGVRDIYAIAVPEPACALLIALALTAVAHLRVRR